MQPDKIIPRFDAYLVGLDLRLEAIAVGGAALALMGVIHRETRDCDLLEPELSGAVREAAVAFAALRRMEGEVLRDDWLNNGPASLVPLLPEGWRDRLRLIYQGQAIVLWSLGRPEFLLAKLWALCDRGLDLADCLALAPDETELAVSQSWIAEQDLNPDWPAHVQATLADLARRLDHGL